MFLSSLIVGGFSCAVVVSRGAGTQKQQLRADASAVHPKMAVANRLASHG